VLIEAIGTIDEATCAIGMARALAQSPQLQEVLLNVQRHLYRLMSHLSATSDSRVKYIGVEAIDVQWLESVIATLETGFPPLQRFVLPGDSVSGATCHQARSTVRRAERCLVTFSEIESGILAPNLAYINRLSSLMFVAALLEDRLAEMATTIRAES